MRETVLRGAAILLGAMWLLAAAGKVAEPLPAYEFLSRITGGGDGTKALLALQIAAEAAVGVAMLLLAIRGLVLTFAGLALATAALLVVRDRSGGLVGCGCFAVLPETSVDAALVRNAVLLAATGALAAWDVVSRRRAGRGAAAESGPATR